MTIKDNYSLSRLFITKQITIFVDKKSFTLQLKTLKELYEDNDWNSVYHIWVAPIKQVQSLFIVPIQSHWDKISQILFSLGQYDRYRDLYDKFTKYLEEILPGIDIQITHKKIVIHDIEMTEELWEYILYILQSSQGERTTKPLQFDSPEAKQFYLAQKANEERIAALRQKNKKGDEDAIAKILLSITYAFPSLTIDYLINQTMAQIQWLQKHAAGAMSYEVNAQAFAAGNMKKGKKLDFFIK